MTRLTSILITVATLFGPVFVIAEDFASNEAIFLVYERLSNQNLEPNLLLAWSTSKGDGKAFAFTGHWIPQSKRVGNQTLDPHAISIEQEPSLYFLGDPNSNGILLFHQSSIEYSEGIPVIITQSTVRISENRVCVFDAEKNLLICKDSADEEYFITYEKSN